MLNKYPSSFYAKILNRNKQYKEKSDKEKEKARIVVETNKHWTFL